MCVRPLSTIANTEQVMDLMDAFGVRDEMELVSGRALKFCKLRNRRAYDAQVKFDKLRRNVISEAQGILLKEVSHMRG